MFGGDVVNNLRLGIILIVFALAGCSHAVKIGEETMAAWKRSTLETRAPMKP